MHREAKNCNWAVQQPGCSNGSSFIRRPHHVPVQKILSSLRMARAIRSKNTIVIFSKGSPELSVPITIAKFSKRSSQSVEKTQDVIRTSKKNNQPFGLATKLLSATKFKLIFKPSLLALIYNCWSDIKEKVFFVRRQKLAQINLGRNPFWAAEIVTEVVTDIGWKIFTINIQLNNFTG